MAETIKGTGVMWSVGTINFTAGITATGGTDHFTQSASVERTSEVTRIKDSGGTVKTVVFHGSMKTLRINVVPCGATVSAATSNGSEFVPQAGTLVTVVGPLDTDNYNCISATLNKTVDGVATIDLVLEAGDEGTELATAPIS